jgi:RND family efflux transporter MFP subunit
MGAVKWMGMVLGAAALLGVGGLAGARFLPVSHAKPPQEPVAFSTGPRAVRVQAVTADQSALEVRMRAPVRAREQATLAFVVSGRVVQRAVDVGQRVKKGAILAQLDLAPFQLALQAEQGRYAQLEAELAQLGRDTERSQQLFDADVIAREEFERFTAQHASKQAAFAAEESLLADARRRLEESRLRAPFSGTVTRIFIDRGEYAQTGQAVLSLSATSDLEVEVEVPARLLGTVHVDAGVDVWIPEMGDHHFQGKVRFVGRASSGSGQLFPVVVGLPQEAETPPGALAEVTFSGDAGGCLTVPLSAVLDPSGESPFVYRVRDGKAEEVPVDVVRFSPKGVAVRSKLKVKDLVVVDGLPHLLDGDEVKVIP